MLIRRRLEEKLIEAAQEFPVIALVGPRQSGKTTLAQVSFPDHRYVSLEDYDILSLALSDPRKFLTEYPSASGIILDEIQHAPILLSYMQTIVDKTKKNGFFIVTGSQNFLVDEAITQTLAGRMAVLTLLPLSISELSDAHLLPERIETLIHKGFYPKAHAADVSVERLYSNYIRLYVERDVRQIKNIADLGTFQKFMRLCAGRIGQVVNLTSLGNDCGINQSTVKAWLSLLEASYIIFSLYPYYKNFGKRLIKAPKLYFIDTGLACSLLKIRSTDEVSDHYLRGGLVESLIIADLLKQQHNNEEQPSLYFWRDSTGNEIDCIIDESRYPVPIEIKAGKTIVSDFFKNMDYWGKTTENTHTPRYLVYGGDEDQSWPQAEVVAWKSAGDLIKKVRSTAIKKNK
ncbi:TPA: AAA family ATPase [Candidatus Dependentiae bacterium]|nr:MAG: AAA family ATPase [candidate division TM6 bacterium GW2011_GWF2_43_87]HBL98314.1 AAA family ATPase [Candidatus Dependentiae bacterium]